MDFCLAATGAIAAGSCLVVLVQAIGLTGFIYLTTWLLVIQFALFLVVLAGKMNSKVFKVINIISWTLGWQVTVVFWIYVFPLLNEQNRIKVPHWFDYLSHGGVHLFAVLLFLRYDGVVTFKDYAYPLSVALFYLFAVVTPLKFYGIIVYPKFFDEIGVTVAVILGSIVVTLSSFLAGKAIKKSKDLKVN